MGEMEDATPINLAAHQEAAYQASIDVTIIRIVPIIAMKPGVAMEVMEMEDATQMNLAAHQEAAYQAIIDVTIIRIVLIIAMRMDVAMTMEAMAMEAAEGSSTQSAPKPTTPTASIVRKNRGRRRRT